MYLKTFEIHLSYLSQVIRKVKLEGLKECLCISKIQKCLNWNKLCWRNEKLVQEAAVQCTVGCEDGWKRQSPYSHIHVLSGATFSEISWNQNGVEGKCPRLAQEESRKMSLPAFMYV